MAACRFWMAWACVGWMVVGCSKGGDPPMAASTANRETAKPPAAAPHPKSSAPATPAPMERPESVTARFLEALRSGDRQTVASLLTSAAREETVRLGYEINPPGDPSSRYEVGRVELTPGPSPEALVSSVWTTDVGDGETFSFEAVWIAKREAAGWRISGLAVKDPQNEEPLVFNFEKLEEVFETKEQIEHSALEEAPGHRQALQSSPTTGEIHPRE